MTDDDKQILLNIRNQLSILASFGNDIEHNYDAILDTMKTISILVSKMTPWKSGCVKDIHDSSLWKNLEYFIQVINNEKYKDILKERLPDILHEFFNLDSHINNIIQIEEEMELELMNSSDKKKTESEHGKKRKSIRDLPDRPGFSNFRKLMMFHQNYLNLSISWDYLKNFNVIYSLGIDEKFHTSLLFRLLQVLGESSKQLTSDLKVLLPGETDSYWGLLGKIRDLLAHKSDKNQKICQEKIQNIFACLDGSPEKILISKILEELSNVSACFNMRKDMYDQILLKPSQEAWDAIQSIDLGHRLMTLTDPDCALKILSDYLKQNRSQLQLNAANQPELVAKASVSGRSVETPLSPLDNAINMVTDILSVIGRLNQLRETGKVHSMDEYQEKVKNLLRYAFEYEISDIGEICKSLEKSNYLKCHSIPSLDAAISNINLFRDQLMHHQYDINDGSVENNLTYLLDFFQPQLELTLKNLKVEKIFQEIDQLIQSYPKNHARERESKNKEPPGEYRKLQVVCHAYLSKCSDIDLLLKEDWPSKLRESKEKVVQFYQQKIVNHIITRDSALQELIMLQGELNTYFENSLSEHQQAQLKNFFNTINDKINEAIRDITKNFDSIIETTHKEFLFLDTTQKRLEDKIDIKINSLKSSPPSLSVT